MKIRENLNKLYKKRRISRKIFTAFRNKVTTELRIAKAKYFEVQFDTHKSNIRKTWEVINSVIKSKRVKSKEFWGCSPLQSASKPPICVQE